MEVKVEKEEVFFTSDIVKEEFTIQEVHPAETKVKEAENEPTLGSSQGKQNSNEKKFQCPDCPRTFTALGLLNRHRKLVQDRKRAEETKELTFQCPKCPKAFWAKNHLAKHIKVHSYHVSLTCDTCGKTFKNKSCLIAHLKTHKEPEHVCKECGKKYRAIGSLRLHTLKIHLGLSGYDISGKVFKCDQCDAQFPSGKGLYKHRDVHNTVRKFKCPKCPMAMKKRSYLNQHLQNVHAEERAFECSTCGHTFKSRSSLKHHVVRHKEEWKKVACKVCGKTLTHDYMKKHMTIHNNKMLECALCGNKYKWKNSIRCHLMKVHLKICEFDISDKKFTCDQCGKVFHKKNQHTRHLATHTTVKAFKCPFCAKAFKTKDYHNVHIKLYHTGKSKGEPPRKNRKPQHDCKICGKLFQRWRYLKAHLARHDKSPHFPELGNKKKKVTAKQKGAPAPKPLAVNPNQIKTESIDEDEVETALETQNENDYELESWIKVERELIKGEEL